MGIFYFIHVPVRQSDQMKWDPIDFDVYFWIFLIYISSFFICFLLLQLMKIESERLRRWITEYLNWNLVNCLEDSYAHKYTTNTHVIHCGLATSTCQCIFSPSLLVTAKQCLEINGSLVSGYDSRFGCERSRVQIPDEPFWRAFNNVRQADLGQLVGGATATTGAQDQVDKWLR